MKCVGIQLPLRICTGCTACITACPTSALSVTRDVEGFAKPVLNEKACVSCGKCVRSCPVAADNAQELLHASPTQAYAIVSRSHDLQLGCTSGGFFTTVALRWVQRGGIVYGAAYEKDFSVCHIRASNVNEARRLSDSKYVQSRIEGVFRRVWEDLDRGVRVLFSGTACQVAGLRSFLGKEHPNLTCVDVICHGVPSPWVWEWYIGKLSERDGKVIGVRQKGKEKGGWSWRQQFLEARFESGNVLRENIWSNAYMRAFLKDLMLNRACHACQFKSEKVNRPSDITIADFWGCEDVEPSFFDASGVSLVIVSTEKGQELLKENRDLLAIKETDIDAALAYNMAARRPYRMPWCRSLFFKLFDTRMSLEEFDRVVEICERILWLEGLPSRLFGRLKSLISNLLVGLSLAQHESRLDG